MSTTESRPAGFWDGVARSCIPGPCSRGELARAGPRALLLDRRMIG